MKKNLKQLPQKTKEKLKSIIDYIHIVDCN